MITFDLTKLDSTGVNDLALHYEEQGFCVLTGLEEAVTRHFYPVIAGALGVSSGSLRDILDRNGSAHHFERGMRQKLARVPTDSDLADGLFRGLRPVLLRLLGPLAHISSTFHAQFKGGSAAPVDHGGYEARLDYMEVHGAYLLHQDFTGASIPTTPSALTLWLGLNKCPDWKLRLYPGSHRLGLLCHKWLQLDDEHLQHLGQPIEIEARPGNAVIFNSLVLHGTGEAGPLRRVSCDIRFFPLCGFLPTDPRLLSDSPLASIDQNLDGNPGPVLRAPLMEDLVLLGREPDLGEVPPCSMLNWAGYLARLRSGEDEEAIRYLKRFVNEQKGVDTPDVYISNFHGHPMHEDHLGRLRRQIAPKAYGVSAES